MTVTCARTRGEVTVIYSYEFINSQSCKPTGLSTPRLVDDSSSGQAGSLTATRKLLLLR
ncbi:MAG: hypothetical protein AABZ61_06185 [Bacteroidota bacterium]